MAKFESIWGDLDVRGEAISQVEKDPKPVDKVEAPDTVKPTEDTKVQPDAETSEGVKPAEATEEEEEYEFSEEDVDKAYGMLEEEGVLELGDDDEFDATPKGLADAVAMTVRNKLKKELAAIPPVVQDLYAHVVGGKDPSSFTFKQHSWGDVDIESADEQKKVLRQLYKTQGMSDEDIADELADATELGKLEKKAKAAQSVLVKAEEEGKAAQEAATAKATAEAEAKAAKEVEELKSTIDEMDELAGFKLDDGKKKDFKKYLFDINARTGKTQMQENMASADRRMKIAFLDFVDYSKADLEKEVTTKLSKNRKKRLSKYTDKNVANRNASSIKKNVSNAKGKLNIPSLFGTSMEVED